MSFDPNHDIEFFFGRDLSDLPQKELNRQVERALHYWRKKGFPYPKLSRQEILQEYRKLERVDTRAVIIGRRIIASTVGLGLANSFHPQMWQISSKGNLTSPLFHFHSDATLRKLLLRAVRFWPNRQCWSAYTIRNAFGIYSGGRVANFRPTAARALIQTFSREHARVLDFCSGFGGRLLGSLSLNRQYIGIDASKKQVSGLNRMYRILKPHAPGSAEIFHACAEDMLPGIPTRSIDLVITSPPYFDLERYSVTPEQSYIRYDSYPTWKTQFLDQVIVQSHRVLKRGGFFVINVCDNRKYAYAITKDVESTARRYFRSVDQYQLIQNARPVQRKNGVTYKTEPVYIFQKK
jgi:hypothetical protein